MGLVFVDSFVGYESYLTHNIIEKIKNDSPFFPDLHWIFAACPNVTPIIVTTGVGPQGKRTLYMQSPSDDDGDSITFTPSQVSQIKLSRMPLTSELLTPLIVGRPLHSS
jgi:hypothetical protein